MKRLNRLWSLNSLLYLALLLALLSSLRHVAFAFGTVNGGHWFESYLSAVAIDVGLLALAAGINQRKAQRRGARWLWAGVGFFSVISVYANWLAGLAHVEDIAGADNWLVTLRPVLLSAVLPVLVIYLSEIVSGNHAADVAQGEREAKRRQNQDTGRRERLQSDDTVTRAGDARVTAIDTRRAAVLARLQAGETQEDIAQAVGVSLRTIKRDIKELNGQVGR